MRCSPAIGPVPFACLRADAGKGDDFLDARLLQGFHQRVRRSILVAAEVRLAVRRRDHREDGVRAREAFPPARRHR
jgi:hypothetical protein